MEIYFYFKYLIKMDEFKQNYLKNGRVKRGFWENRSNHKLFADFLEKQLKYTCYEDWYQITKRLIIENNGGGLLGGYYSNSPYQFVKAMFQGYEFLEWKFSVSTMSFWEQNSNHNRYVDWLAKKLKYTCPKDWYKITTQLIYDNNGSGLLTSYYSNSPIKLVKAMFPEYEFLEWKFSVSTMGFWKQNSNHKLFADWLGKQLKYTCHEDWYQITKRLIIENNGGGLLGNYYSDSPSQFVKAMFPEYEFLEWKFAISQNGFWKQNSNHNKYVDWLGKKLKYTCPEDWYKITTQLIYDNNGSGLLSYYYSNSPIQFVKAMFSEYEFLEWKFVSTQKGFWEQNSNHNRYADWLGKQLKYTCYEDWYQITTQLIHDNNGCGLLGGYYSNSPYQFVKAMFPEYKWILSKFKKCYSLGQIKWLEYNIISTPDIRHALHDTSEFRIPNSRYSADGYSISKNCIYEYHGDFWHGNPKIFVLDDINPITKTTYRKLYENTLKKQRFCEESGYKYYSVWENEWIRGEQSIIKLQRLFITKKHKKLLLINKISNI